MQNDPLSHGLWETSAPPAPPTSPLNGRIKADVAVVGCGYTGLSAALRLAELGAKVVALEAVEIGFGGAGRNVGLVNAGMWVMPREFPKALGPDYGERALTLLGGAPGARSGRRSRNRRSTAIPCITARCSARSAAQGLAEIEERARQWGERGAPVRVLTAAETAKRIGSEAYAGCAPRPARRNHPAAVLRARPRPRRDRRRRGDSHPKRGSQRGAERAASGGSQRSGGTVEADWVAVATDAYGGAPWPQGRREQVHLPYFNFATDAAQRRASGLDPAGPRRLLGHQERL